MGFGPAQYGDGKTLCRDYTDAVMNRLARYWRAQPLYSALLIAALLMRGLIPAGYMPAAGHGFFALELCSAVQTQLPEPASDATAHHHHGDMADGQTPASDTSSALAHNHHHNGSTTPAEHSSPCPFAATALCAPLPAVAFYAPAIEALPTHVTSEPQVLTSYLIVRAQSARAPPAFS
jgi:hypothetical protein